MSDREGSGSDESLEEEEAYELEKIIERLRSDDGDWLYHMKPVDLMIIIPSVDWLAVRRQNLGVEGNV